MSRPKPPTVQVVNELDDPYLLVRAETADEARELALAWLALHSGPWFDAVDQGFVFDARAVREGWFRWLPANAFLGDYDRWLVSATAGTRGAFHAFEVQVAGVVSVGAA